MDSKINQIEQIEALLQSLREDMQGTAPSLGQRAADRVAKTVGSWTFIILQSSALLIWMYFNSRFTPWDPYPFILLNLVLSFQAAFASPVLLMAQNRSDELDRRNAQDAYAKINTVLLVMQQRAASRDDSSGSSGPLVN